MKRYPLNVARDVDTDEPDTFIMNLISGWKFNHDQFFAEHIRAFDTMKELRAELKDWVVPCDCEQCRSEIARGQDGWCLTTKR